MNQVFSLVLQQSLLGVLLFGITYLVDQMIQKKSLNQWRSFLWTLYFGALLVPAQLCVASFLPSKTLPPVLLEIPLSHSLNSFSPGMETVRSFDWMQLGFFLWAIGVVLSIAGFIIVPFLKDRRLRKSFSKKSQPFVLGDQSSHSLFFVDDQILPFVSGLFRSKIYFPKNLVKHLSEEQLKSVLLHEKAHILNKDLIKILLARFSISVFWFCPFVYMAYYKMREAQEYVADQYALTQNKKISQSEYAKTLLKVSMLGELETRGAFGVSILNKSHLRKRIEALSNFHPNEKRKILFPVGLAVVVVAISLMVFRFDIFNPVDSDIVTVLMEIKDGETVIAKPKMISKYNQEVMIFIKNKEGYAWAMKAVPSDSSPLVTFSGIICENPKNIDGFENLSVEIFDNFDCQRKQPFTVGTRVATELMLKSKNSYEYKFKILRGNQPDASWDGAAPKDNILIDRTKESVRKFHSTEEEQANRAARKIIDSYFGLNNQKRC